MTKNQLSKLGLIQAEYTSNPNQYWSDACEEFIHIPKNATLFDVAGIIFNEGLRQGVIEGKKQRSAEIKSLLND